MIDSKIALCLSGGGFRATFFHLGVIRFLREAGLIKNLRHVISVSGGSILAAHMARFWESYSGEMDAFNECAATLERFAREDVRGWILRRWLQTFGLADMLPSRMPLLGRYRRPVLLQRRLSQLYETDADISLLRPSMGENKPAFHILSTSVRTGRLCSFEHGGVTLHNEGGSVDDTFDAPNVPLCLAVAASCAFPPLFPPVELRRQLLAATVQSFPYDPDYLTDGGVYDNVGVRKLQRLMASDRFNADLMLISDASAPFDWDTEGEYANIVSRTVRTTDILMKRVADLEEWLLDMQSSADQRLVKISITEAVEDSEQLVALDVSLQRRLAGLRTDLDSFTRLEILSLMQHGYEIAHHRCSSNAKLAQQCPPTPDLVYRPMDAVPAKAQRSVIARSIEAGRKRKIGLFRLSDPATWSLLMVLAVIVVGGIYSSLAGIERFLLWLEMQRAAPIIVAEDVSALNAVLWQQKSREYSSSTMQVFTMARRLLDLGLMDDSWTALPQMRLMPSAPPAVILDIDDTVLDTSPFTASSVRGLQSFSTQRWNEWVLRANAKAVPGAINFVQYCAQRGVTVFYVTNRSPNLEHATRMNLTYLGISLPDGVDTVLVRGEGNGGISSDKSSRYKTIAMSYRVVLVVGDQVDDFLLNRNGATSYESMWGMQWLIIPNPVYGGWEREAVGDSMLRGDAVIQRKFGALRYE